MKERKLSIREIIVLLIAVQLHAEHQKQIKQKKIKK